MPVLLAGQREFASYTSSRVPAVAPVADRLSLSLGSHRPALAGLLGQGQGVTYPAAPAPMCYRRAQMARQARAHAHSPSHRIPRFIPAPAVTKPPAGIYDASPARAAYETAASWLAPPLRQVRPDFIDATDFSHISNPCSFRTGRQHRTRWSGCPHAAVRASRQRSASTNCVGLRRGRERGANATTRPWRQNLVSRGFRLFDIRLGWEFQCRLMGWGTAPG